MARITHSTFARYTKVDREMDTPYVPPNMNDHPDLPGLPMWVVEKDRRADLRASITTPNDVAIPAPVGRSPIPARYFRNRAV